MDSLAPALKAHASIRGVGSSDIQRIHKGDWHALWLEKTGRIPPEDLTWRLPVQIGRALEPVILDFYAHDTGRVVLTGDLMRTRLPGRRVLPNQDGRTTFFHPAIEWAITSPDGLSVPGDDFFDGNGLRAVEAKTTNYWNATKQTPQFIASYSSQLQWHLEVLGLGLIDFAFPVDNQRIEIHSIERDECFASQLLADAEEFWDCVLRDREPRKGRPEPKTPAPRIVATRTVSMMATKEANAWGDAAGRWKAHRWAAAAYTQAAQDLKGLMPKDARKATGAGITLTRDAAGRISITNEEEE